MYISSETLDDLLNDLYRKFLAGGDGFNRIVPRKGEATEYFGAVIELKNPRARLSRSVKKGTIFSCLGELSWYLAGSEDIDHIKYYISNYDNYSDDGKTAAGAYGPRIFKVQDGCDQFHNIIEGLRSYPDSRRAVLQILDLRDLFNWSSKDVPCTIALQFALRNDKLDLMTFMRSNDLYKGLPHDVFCFTMLQEIISKKIGVRLGKYIHSVGSLHFYDENRESIEDYLNEGFQTTMKPMDEMPETVNGDIIEFLESEKCIRVSGGMSQNIINSYWDDLIRLLMAFKVYKTSRDVDRLSQIRSNLIDKKYEIYIEKIIEKLAWE